MWDLLEEADQQILTHFVMACFLLTARIIEDSVLDETHSQLLMVVHLRYSQCISSSLDQEVELYSSIICMWNS